MVHMLCKIDHNTIRQRLSEETSTSSSSSYRQVFSKAILTNLLQVIPIRWMYNCQWKKSIVACINRINLATPFVVQYFSLSYPSKLFTNKYCQVVLFIYLSPCFIYILKLADFIELIDRYVNTLLIPISVN